MKPQIVNIINFIRGTEPRYDVDLKRAVAEQISLIKRYRLTGTFLLQYDALINPDYIEILSAYSDYIEVGGWLEIVEPLCEAAGIRWRGRPGYSWDWHANVGFTVGYPKSERLKLADVFMEKFKQIWGFYPASVGSWIIDAITLAYLSERYGIIASCNCKDQWGTDGYTIWGGYYSQAYYPSKTNVLCPAQSIGQQISVPVFRMLGSDPIYQYDYGLSIDGGSPECQKVITLEPVYSGSEGGGGNSFWTDWFFRENFNGICLSFGYAQVGQENSFGWDSTKDGLTYQLDKVARLSYEGVISVQTLAQSGEWFKKNYDLSPASALAALSDWKNNEFKSIWYNCRNYRINFLCKEDKFRIRDIYIFDEHYKERYFDELCYVPLLIFDNLPVMDGNRWSGNGVLAGIYPISPSGNEVEFDRVDVSEYDNNLLIKWSIKSGDIVSCVCRPEGIEWSFPSPGYSFEVRVDSSSINVTRTINREQVHFKYRDFGYSVLVNGADVSFDERGVLRFKIREKSFKIFFDSTAITPDQKSQSLGFAP